MQPPETATTIRVRDGETLTTDGPFAETKEAIGGYLLFEADDLDAAIELASRIPAARMGGAVEVRPLVARGVLASPSTLRDRSALHRLRPAARRVMCHCPRTFELGPGV